MVRSIRMRFRQLLPLVGVSLLVAMFYGGGSRTAHAALIGENYSPGLSSVRSADDVHRRTPGCSLDGTGTKCLGLLDASFMKTRTRAELMRAYREIAPTKGAAAMRWPTGPCTSPKPCLSADTWANSANRDFDITHLPTGRAIVVGAIEWNSPHYKDNVYGAGENGEGNSDGRRTIFVVYRPPSPTAWDPTYGKVIGQWILFGKRRGADAVDSLAGGQIVKCDSLHTGPATSGFLGCPAAHALMNLSVQTNIPFARLLDARTCDAAARAAASDAECKRQMAAKWNALLTGLGDKGKAFLKLAPPSALGDDSRDTYWFSCALGCCTADILL